VCQVQKVKILLKILATVLFRNISADCYPSHCADTNCGVADYMAKRTGH
jgi:hypothetical protein